MANDPSLRFFDRRPSVKLTTQENARSSGALMFWSAIRPRSRVLITAAVFCLFGAVALMALQMRSGRVSGWDIVRWVFLSGGFAVVYFLILISRKMWAFVPVVLLQMVLEWGTTKHSHAGATLEGAALQRQLMVLAFGAIFGIVAAYSLMIHFFRVEGRRYFQIRAEMALAAEIHGALVPSCSAKMGGFEIYGASVPSGEVGGDLVDVVPMPKGWIGYVADVSGHGVQSGVLMAMFKTALRSQVANGMSLRQMLCAVNRTLFPLKLGNMFVTTAVLQGGDGGKVAYASAGHPAILQYHRKTRAVTEHGALDPPLGITEGQEFSEGVIACENGDVLLVLTDGLTEVFDARGNEIGVEAVKKEFASNVALELEELFRRLRSVVNGFGSQTDDQTVLLARYID